MKERFRIYVRNNTAPPIHYKTQPQVVCLHVGLLLSITILRVSWQNVAKLLLIVETDDSKSSLRHRKSKRINPDHIVSQSSERTMRNK